MLAHGLELLDLLPQPVRHDVGAGGGDQEADGEAAEHGFFSSCGFALIAILAAPRTIGLPTQSRWAASLTSNLPQICRKLS